MSVEYDARCLVCGDVHVIWVSDRHDEGERIGGYRHTPGCVKKASGGLPPHRLEARLRAIPPRDQGE